MPLDFYDTSALAKLYTNEAGSRWVRQQVRVNQVAIAELAYVEVASVFARRTREGLLTGAQRDGLIQAFAGAAGAWVRMPISLDLIQRAGRIVVDLPASIPLRSLDAIHLACAEEAFAAAARSGAVIGALVSSDPRLLAAAQWLGLATDNPEHHI